MAAPFHCRACGPLDRVHAVETVVSWSDVEVHAGVVVGLGDTTMYSETGDDQHFECPACSGPATMDDGSPIELEDWQ
jgi:hypothetical protein